MTDNYQNAEEATHRNFKLPGQPEFMANLFLAISIAFSGRWNPRSLECHFYILWNLIFGYLIESLRPFAVVAAQYKIDVWPDDQPRLTSSIATLPQPKSEEKVPDFVVLLARPVNREDNNAIFSEGSASFFDWMKMNVEKLEMSLIAEIKPQPTRNSSDKEVFHFSLLYKIKSARKDALRQGKLAFKVQNDKEEVILFACCGVWWSWRLLTESQVSNRAESVKVNTGQTKEKLAESNDPRTVTQPSKGTSGKESKYSHDHEPYEFTGKLDTQMEKRNNVDRNKRVPGSTYADPSDEEDEEDYEDEDEEEEEEETENKGADQGKEKEQREAEQGEAEEAEQGKEGEGKEGEGDEEGEDEDKDEDEDREGGKEEDEEGEEELTSEGRDDSPDRDTSHQDDAGNMQEAVRLFYSDVGDELVGPITGDISKAIPRKRWTRPLLLGSDASNQHMYLVHTILAGYLDNIVPENAARQAAAKAEKKDVGTNTGPNEMPDSQESVAMFD